MGVAEIGAGEVGAGDVGDGEVGAGEVRTCEGGESQIGAGGGAPCKVFPKTTDVVFGPRQPRTLVCLRVPRWLTADATGRARVKILDYRHGSLRTTCTRLSYVSTALTYGFRGVIASPFLLSAEELLSHQDRASCRVSGLCSVGQPQFCEGSVTTHCIVGGPVVLRSGRSASCEVEKRPVILYSHLIPG